MVCIKGLTLTIGKVHPKIINMRVSKLTNLKICPKVEKVHL